MKNSRHESTSSQTLIRLLQLTTLSKWWWWRWRRRWRSTESVWWRHAVQCSRSADVIGRRVLVRSGRGCGRRRRRGSRRGTETVHLSHCIRKRRILLSHSITIHSTRNTVAGCQKRQMSITLVNLTKKNTRTHKKRDNLRTQNYKERKEGQRNHTVWNQTIRLWCRCIKYNEFIPGHCH